jgi:hypothetical protein
MKIHKSITMSKVLDAIQSGDDIGFCIECGEQHYGCEPDAQEYECEACMLTAVYGAEQLLFMIGE